MDFDKIKNLVNNFPKNVELIALPVIEYWGGPEKVRLDVNPWKWRLSRNLPHITHGIPANLRKFDKDGHVSVDANKGDIIMFPSDLLHYVIPNSKEDDRISISMNLQLS